MGNLPIEEGSARVGPAGRELHHCWTRPEDAPWSRLVLFHGYAEHSGRHLHWMREAAAAGVECRAFDFRGHGHSWGRRGAVREWRDYLLDAAEALRHISAEGATAPLLLMGHSHGALVLLHLLKQQPALSPSGVILSNPYVRNRVPIPAWKHSAALALSGLAPHLHMPNGLRADWMSGDLEMVSQSRADPLVFSVATPRWYRGVLQAQAKLRREPARLPFPTLLLIGAADRVADPDAGESLLSHVEGPATLKRWPELRHELLRESRRAEVLEEMLAWMKSLSSSPP